MGEIRLQLTIGNEEKVESSIILLIGTCRSGKTTLAQILASMENVEWIEEPWELLQIPILESLNLINKNAAQNIIKGAILERLNDNILLRNANFRENDLSSIFKVKTKDEINNRLNNLNTREDVKKHIKKNNSVFIFNLPEINFNIELFFNFFQNIKIIHVVRNGLEVAKDMEEKKWFDERSLLSPSNNDVFFKREINKKYFYIPWWVEEKYAKYFIKLSEYNKGLYYWLRILSINDFYKKEKLYEKEKNYKIIKYEDLIENTEDVSNEIKAFLGKEFTELTFDLIESLKDRKIKKIRKCNFDIFGKQIKNIFKNYGY